MISTKHSRTVWRLAALAAILCAGAVHAGESKRRVDGQVLAPNGTGVGDARVVLQRGGTPDKPGSPIGEATTDAFGQFSIDLPSDDTTDLHIRASREGFQPYYGPVEFIGDDQEAFVDITLQGRGSLSGRVLRADSGDAVPQARVVLNQVARSLQAETDNEGRFAFDGLTGGAMSLRVTKPGLATLCRELAEVPSDDVVFELAPERTLLFDVRDDRIEPVVGASITVVTACTTFEAQTNNEGQATVHGVPQDAETVQFVVEHADYIAPGPGWVTRRLPRTRTQPHVITVHMERAGRIAGVISAAAGGEPIANARVLVGQRFVYGMPMGWTDEQGRFDIGGIRPGRTRITVQHPRFAPTIQPATIEPGERIDLSITMDSGSPIEGIVQTHDGKPAANVRVMAIRWQNTDTPGLRTITDDQGRFRFDHAPPGPIDFWFIDPSNGSRTWKILRAGKTDYAIALAEPPAPPTMLASAPSEKLIGKAFPDTTLHTCNDKELTIESFKGKYVFVDVWATWCPPCRAEMPTLKKLHETLGKRDDFAMIGISMDESCDEVKTFTTEHDLPWPQVAGEGSGARRIADALGVRGIPFNCLVAPDGKIIAVDLHGPDLPNLVTQAVEEHKAK
jgi:thiol-disulfide isomerase/thioredoxin